MLTYGVNQSVAWAIGGFAIRFYMKEPRLGGWETGEPGAVADPYYHTVAILMLSLVPDGRCGPLPRNA